jgi:hypothetical protein
LLQALSGDNATLVANGGVMGWLFKKGKLNTAWKKRFVALYGGHLYYFAGQCADERGKLAVSDILDAHPFHERNPPSGALLNFVEEPSGSSSAGNGAAAGAERGGNGGGGSSGSARRDAAAGVGGAFVVQTRGGREFRFFADSRQTCDTWVQHIQRAMRAARR